MEGSTKYLVSEVRIALFERRFGFQGRHIFDHKNLFQGIDIGKHRIGIQRRRVIGRNIIANGLIPDLRPLMTGIRAHQPFHPLGVPTDAIHLRCIGIDHHVIIVERLLQGDLIGQSRRARPPATANQERQLIDIQIILSRDVTISWSSYAVCRSA